MNNELQNNIQLKAVKAWVKAGKKGTLEVSTGVGKTFMALHCLQSMPKNKKLHLFLAETTSRLDDLIKDINKFNKIFDVDILNDYNLQFQCYQTVYKWKNIDIGLVIADEIHNSLSKEYSNFYLNNNYDAIVGLSATVDRKTEYIIDGSIVNKGMLLDSIAPVCFKYTLAQSKEDGVGRELNIYVIHQELNSVNKDIKAGSLSKPFFQTEKQSYDYWEKEHKKSWFIEDEDLKSLKIRITAKKRSDLLFNLPSKIGIVKQLISKLKGKIIVFGNSLDSLLKVTPNTVSSRYSEAQNKAIRDHFDNDVINVIGSFKKLRQGANLKELDNAIIMSYYSSDVHIIQQLGRLRKNKEKIGNAFILLTKNTQEEVWFEKLIKNLTEFNVIYCDDLEDCLNKYKINEKN